MHYLIYKITCTINDKHYIGVTNNLVRRLRDHRNPNSNCKALCNAIQLHGWDNFEVRVLVDRLSRQDAYDLEPELIIEHLSRIPTGYNITAGGWNGRSGMTYTMSDKHKLKISIAHRGMKHTEETKSKLRDIKATPEYKERVEQTRCTETYRHNILVGLQSDKWKAERARRKTSEYSEQQRLSSTGRVLSEESKQKISNSLTGRIGTIWTAERRLAVSNSMVGHKQPTEVCIHCGLVGSITNIKRWHNDNCKSQHTS